MFGLFKRKNDANVKETSNSNLKVEEKTEISNSNVQILGNETEQIELESQQLANEQDKLKKYEEYKRQKEVKEREWYEQEQEKKKLKELEEQEKKRLKELEEQQRKESEINRYLNGEVLTTRIGKISWYDDDEEEFHDGKLTIDGYVLNFTLDSGYSFATRLEENIIYTIHESVTEYSHILSIYSETDNLKSCFTTDYKLLREKDKYGKTIQQSVLVHDHFSLLNQVTNIKRNEIREKINNISEELLGNQEICDLAHNYFLNTKHDVFIDFKSMIVYERLLMINFPLGIETLTICDDRSNAFKVFNSINDGFEDEVDADYILSYHEEYFKKLVAILHKRFSFDSVDLAFYVTWKTLKEIAKSYFFNHFKNEYGVWFEEINTQPLVECVRTYINIETINPKSQANASLLTYYLMANDKFQTNDNFLVCYHQLVDIILEQLKHKEIDDFESKLLKKPSTQTITISDIDLMTGLEFESFIANLFSKMGYSTEVTKASGDQGIDVIAEKNGMRIGIQAKCYSSAITNKAIQEVSAGINHYGLDKGMVVTNNYFTDSAIKLADSNGIILWDRNMLKEKINEVF